MRAGLKILAKHLGSLFLSTLRDETTPKSSRDPQGVYWPVPISRLGLAFSFFIKHTTVTHVQDHIVQIGDPILKEVAKPVSKKDIGSRKLNSIIKRMKALLHKEEFGVAIAAPQIGESIRLFIIAGKAFVPAAKKGEEEQAPPADKVFINPTLERLSRAKKEMSEGCLSVRNQYGSVVRHQKATIHALNEKGEAFMYHGSGLIGHIFQHEVDHLEGILYVEKAVSIEKDEGFKKLKEKRRKGAE
ncbi:MAG: peptide deformylase [Parcubacteria group bacterium Gr01-1014_56]|nr:MAG: peptide deformylase [Parcubacteria group bacterium Gr01-1014_56]